MKVGVLGDILLAVLWAIIAFYNFYSLLVYEHIVWSHNSFMLGIFFAGFFRFQGNVNDIRDEI